MNVKRTTWLPRLSFVLVTLTVTSGRADDAVPDAGKGEAKKDGGWTSLFDGKSLDGWKANERPENWKVEDGCIVGRGQRSHLFYMGGDFENFEFQADVKTEKGANSGIYFHTKFQAEGWPEAGHEAQVNNTHGDPVKTGSLYNVVKLYKTETKDGQWWTQSIKVEGKRITITVDGKTVVDYAEPDSVKGARRLSKGTFALQQHDPGSVVRYRNIKVKRLPATKS